MGLSIHYPVAIKEADRIDELDSGENFQQLIIHYK